MVYWSIFEILNSLQFFDAVGIDFFSTQWVVTVSSMPSESVTYDVIDVQINSKEPGTPWLSVGGVNTAKAKVPT